MTHVSKPIILGSGSLGRRMVLDEAGITYTVVTADIDEKALRDPDPRILTAMLAQAKAAAILARLDPDTDAYLITADQVAWCAGQILEKPRDLAEAREFYTLYQQHLVSLIGGIRVTDVRSRRYVDLSAESRLRYTPIPEDILTTAISHRMLMRAGGIGIEDEILRPYLRLEVGDPTAAMGLPIDRVLEVLQHFDTYAR